MNKPPMIFLWTGPKHSGKSSKAIGLVEKAKSQGLKVGGVLAPSRYENGKLLGFDIINLQTGQRRLLSSPGSEKSGGERFEFTEAGGDFGKDALNSENLKSCHLVLLDEFGPFEIEGGGWRQEVDLLVKLNTAPLLMIVREEIKVKVQEIYGIPKEHVFEFQNQDDIVSFIKKAAGDAEIR